MTRALRHPLAPPTIYADVTRLPGASKTMARLLNVDIPARHGMLEGLLRLPDSADAPPAMAAVVCHPHPQFGGTMHNKVVFRIAQALGDLTIPALRFNFRGVGRSTGAYDEGR